MGIGIKQKAKSGCSVAPILVQQDGDKKSPMNVISQEAHRDTDWQVDTM
jgi:hypothetical protein